MKTKRIKVTKETVSKEVVELKEEDLDKVVGGEIGVNERYRTDEEDWTIGGADIIITGYRTCEACGYKIGGSQAHSIKGVSCPKCGHFNM